MRNLRKAALFLTLAAGALGAGAVRLADTEISAAGADPAAPLSRPGDPIAPALYEGAQKASCDTRAYLADEDPNGTNIRSKPDRNAPVVKVLKTQHEVVVHITGEAGNGWFEVDFAETAGADEDVTLFEGRGWVHSSVLGLSVGSGDARLYSAPQKKSRVVKKLIPDESPITLVGCRGKWMKVRTGSSLGWMSPESQCANPLTTCA